MLRKAIMASAAAALLGLAVPAAAQIHGAAARVNGVEISNQRLEIVFDETLKSKRRNIASMINPKVYKKLKKETLDELIEAEVLWQAAQAKGIVATDEQVNVAIEELKRQLKTPEAYRRKLELGGYDEKSYAQNVRQNLSGVLYLDRTIAVPEVDAKDVEAWYRDNKQRFTQPETMSARHILVKVERGASDADRAAARARIEDLLKQVKAGADFAELAKAHSQDVSAPDGGMLGEFGRGRMVKPFEEAAFALQPGEVSPIVQTVFGFHIIKAESRKPEVVQAFEAVQDKVRQAMAAQRRGELMKAERDRLRAIAKVEVFQNLD